MPRRILFVVHAGEGVGLGHLTRSLVGARSLALRLGAKVDFVAVGQQVDDTFCKEFEVHCSITHGPIDVVVHQLTKNNQYSAICLDLFNSFLSKTLGLVLENVRKTGCKIVAIDSLFGLEGLIDLLYVPSFLRPTYVESSEFRGRLAYGWDAYLLNIKVQDQAPKHSGSILALTGGSDVTQLGKYWPEVLHKCLPLSSVVHWVTGPFSQRPILPDSSSIEFVEHVAPAGLTSLMQGVQAAVTVYGVSFFELIALGVPTVVFSPYGGKDSRELREIADQRIALVAQDARDAADQVTRLIKDSNLRAKLSSHARGKLKNFDGEYFAAEVGLLFAA